MRPTTQLFMLQSLDGKISTGATDEFDVDKDFPQLPATKEGLSRYYELEKETDIWSLGSGRTMAKCGVNSRPIPKSPFCNFVIIDNKHLDENGLKYFSAASPDKFVLVTTNPSHIAFKAGLMNLHIILQKELNLPELMEKLYELGCKNLTCQVGSTLNGVLFHHHLIDRINLVIAPIIIGGNNTPSLVGGSGLTSHGDISKLNGLRLVKVENLGNGYIHVLYDVMKG